MLLGEPLPTSPATAVPALIASAVLIAGTVVLGRTAPDHTRPAVAKTPSESVGVAAPDPVGTR